MFTDRRVNRRKFIASVTGAAAAVSMGRAFGHRDSKSDIFRVHECPLHDGQMRHQGLDALINLLAVHGQKLFKSVNSHPWAGPEGLIDRNDVVLVKVNCQWKCRGATNTDVLQGFIHRILQHPDGFCGEIVIFENGQGQGAFNGTPLAWRAYASYPEVNGVHVNAEDDTLTVDKLVNTVFKNDPISSFLLDGVRGTFITGSDHTRNGYRILSGPKVSYPCFTTTGGNRIELRDGIWNGSGYSDNLKLINLPVLKTHSGTGITGVLKHTYGILSMNDGASGIRHYNQAGTQCGKMFSLVRTPDLNIVDCIWVSYQDHHRGYPPDTTHRANVLLAGYDPVALDYYGSKHILLPLGGDRAREHDPDRFSGLKNHLSGAQEFINQNGGIRGEQSRQGDDQINLISTGALTSIQDPVTDIDPGDFHLAQNYPNPFNGTTRIGFVLSHSAGVRLIIHDVRGRIVRHLIYRHLPAGRHSAQWDGRDDSGVRVSSGVYCCQMIADGGSMTKMMTLVQ